MSCAVTVQLICVFVFAYPKKRFSHNEAQIRVAETKALIRCAVTAQLICVFVFAYAKKSAYERKPVLGVSDQDQQKPDFAATEES